MRFWDIVTAAATAPATVYPDWTPSLGTGWTQSPAKTFSSSTSNYTDCVISTATLPTAQVTFEVLVVSDLIVGFSTAPNVTSDYSTNQRAVILDAGLGIYVWLIGSSAEGTLGPTPQVGDIVQMIADGTSLIIIINNTEVLNTAYTPSGDIGLSIWGGGSLASLRVVSFGPSQ